MVPSLIHSAATVDKAIHSLINPVTQWGGSLRKGFNSTAPTSKSFLNSYPRNSPSGSEHTWGQFWSRDSILHATQEHRLMLESSAVFQGHFIPLVSMMIHQHKRRVYSPHNGHSVFCPLLPSPETCFLSASLMTAMTNSSSFQIFP